MQLPPADKAASVQYLLSPHLLRLASELSLSTWPALRSYNRAKFLKLGPMLICICGAGQVGNSLVAQLSSDNEVTVIDTNEEQLNKLGGNFEVNTVLGSASNPTALDQAGIHNFDMLIAVTSSDEVNIVACELASHLFAIKVKIARLRNEAYSNYPHIFRPDALSIDLVINPSALVTDQIQLMTQYPSALQVINFADGKVKLVAIRASSGSPLVGHRISELREHIPHVHVRIAAIYRNDRPIMPESSTVIEDGDEVFFIAEKNNIRRVMSEMRHLDESNKSIFIAGGGIVGTKLAMRLSKRHNVKVFENNKAKCQELASKLYGGTVINSSATDRHALLEENVDQCDIFCALTNNDEVNLLSGLTAKHLGAKKSMVLLNNHLYHELIDRAGMNIDAVLEPQEITISQLLAYIRRGSIEHVHSLHNGAAEAIEVIIQPDKVNIVGKMYKDLALPYGTTLGAVVRAKHVHTEFSGLEVTAEDHVLIFLIDKNSLRGVEELFGAMS